MREVAKAVNKETETIKLKNKAFLNTKNIIEKQFGCNKLIMVPCHISLNLNEEVLISSVVDLVKSQHKKCSIKGQGLFIVRGTFKGNNRIC